MSDCWGISQNDRGKWFIEVCHYPLSFMAGKAPTGTKFGDDIITNRGQSFIRGTRCRAKGKFRGVAASDAYEWI